MSDLAMIALQCTKLKLLQCRYHIQPVLEPELCFCSIVGGVAHQATMLLEPHILPHSLFLCQGYATSFPPPNSQRPNHSGLVGCVVDRESGFIFRALFLFYQNWRGLNDIICLIQQQKLDRLPSANIRGNWHWDQRRVRR